MKDTAYPRCDGEYHIVMYLLLAANNLTVHDPTFAASIYLSAVAWWFVTTRRSKPQ